MHNIVVVFVLHCITQPIIAVDISLNLKPNELPVVVVGARLVVVVAPDVFRAETKLTTASRKLQKPRK
jgi:hypothetical protein